MRLFSIALVLLVLSTACCPGEQVFQSGPEQTSLIELYTSEGCSSCPPAERWLSQLRNDPGLWTKIVPVAFHVTYWDKLGWPDKFAEKAFTDRQYSYARLWRSDNVYTPCFVRDGAEWKIGDATRTLRLAGKLVAKLDENGRIAVRFEPDAEFPGSLYVTVALLASEIDSDVKRGENAGRKLRHDFTVIQMVDTALSREAGTGAFSAMLMIPAEKLHGFSTMALAIWVTRDGPTGTVLQAAGGWLKR